MSSSISYSHYNHTSKNPNISKQKNKKGTPFFSSENSFFQPVSQIQTKLTVNTSNDIYEKGADAMADKVMSMSNPQLQQKLPVLQRMCTECEKEEKD